MAELEGLECEFVKDPPSVIQTNCPVCLHIPHEPRQVTFNRKMVLCQDIIPLSIDFLFHPYTLH